MASETGVKIVVEMKDLQKVEHLVSRLADLDEHDLVTNILDLGENQTRKRILAGGPAPDGTLWPPNREGAPTLHPTGDNLLGSLAWTSHGSAGEWGASFPFAHIHQEGAVISPKNAKLLAFSVKGKMAFAHKVTIPKREFLGVSAEDAREIDALVTDFLGELLK